MASSKSPMIPASKSPLNEQQKTHTSDDTISDISIQFKKSNLGTGNLNDIDVNRLSQHTPSTPNPATP